MALVERNYKGTKTYWIAVHQNGKQVWVNGGHQKRAAQELHDRLATKGRESQLPTARDIKFSELVDRYLVNGTHHLREQTITTYKSRLDNHLLPFFSDVKVRRGVTTEAIGRWIAYEKHLMATDHTIRRCLVTLSAVLSHAVDIGLISQNPVAKIKTKKNEGVATGVDYVLSAEQTALLIKHTPSGNDRALMTMMFHTGARPSECSELRFGDCDWNAQTITISRTATKKGQNGTKNGLARVVPMTPALRHELQEQKRLMNAGTDDLVFPTKNGKRRDMQRFARDILRPSLTRSGLRVPEGSAVNYLARKTCISLLISQGASPSLVAQVVGSSAQQILKTYTKVRQEDTVAAMHRFAASMTTDARDTNGTIAQSA